jgi:hypothetical protein
MRLMPGIAPFAVAVSVTFVSMVTGLGMIT